MVDGVKWCPTTGAGERRGCSTEEEKQGRWKTLGKARGSEGPGWMAGSTMRTTEDEGPWEWVSRASVSHGSTEAGGLWLAETAEGRMQHAKGSWGGSGSSTAQGHKAKASLGHRISTCGLPVSDTVCE